MGDYTKHEGEVRARANIGRKSDAQSGAQSGGNRTVLLSDLAEADAAAPSVSSPEPRPAVRTGLDADVLAALSTRYEILADAGRGSMGNVYKARDRETGGIVALKLLKPEIASDQGMIDRFKNELLFARKITHKNVCRVYEFNRVNGVAYTSMEFVEGEGLRSVLNRTGKLHTKQAVTYASQMCSGLKEAHAQGIVHRDLKPENVMIDSRGSVKIMDFGIARSMDVATRLTGSLAGTPAYMAPEQVAGKSVDYRTDIYSLGLMLYEMFTGRPAFEAENSVAVALKQMREEPVAPHIVEPSIPVSIERAILKCLEKEPARRFLSVSELQTALEAPHAERTIIAPVASAASQPSLPAAAKPDATLHATNTAQLAISAPRAHSNGVSPLVWVLVGAGVVLAGFGAQKVYAIQRAAADLVFAEKFSTPVPPSFAYDIPAAPVVTPAPDAPPATESAAATPPAAPKPAAKSIDEKSADKKIVKSKKPAADKPEVAAAAPPHTDVFPRMETGPLKKHSQSASSTGLEYLWLGRFERKDAADKKAQFLKKSSYNTLVVLRHFGHDEFYALFVGPIQIQKEAATKQALEAKGFLNIHALPPSLVVEKGKK